LGKKKVDFLLLEFLSALLILREKRIFRWLDIVLTDYIKWI